MRLSPADLLLWSRCRRQWRDICLDGSVTNTEDAAGAATAEATAVGAAGAATAEATAGATAVGAAGAAGIHRWPALPTEMTAEANLRELARVIHLGQRHVAPDGDDAAIAALDGLTGAPPVAGLAWIDRDPTETDRWLSRSSELLEVRRPVWNALVSAGELLVLLDAAIWHPRLEAWQVYLFRPATGLRGAYQLEAAMVAWAMGKLNIPLGELQLAYLDKRHQPASNGEPAFDLFRFSNVTRRAARRAEDVGHMVRSLAETARSGVISDEYVCGQRCNRCVSEPDHRDRPAPRYSVHTLHKGKQLAQELASEGLHDLREIDESAKRFSAKQRIQIASVRNDRTHVDQRLLSAFLDRLVYPLHFLDFEAYAASVPVFQGLAPYEHMPVIASLHTRTEPGSAPSHVSFAMEPGRDQRPAFFSWLRGHLGTAGSIVVFSKGFEAGMVRQLARTAGDPEAGEAVVRRMVDLLEPFAGFALYHPKQLGRVSLKRVLPAFTDADYGESPLKDGMHANLGFSRLADRALAAHEAEPTAGAARAAEAVSEAIAQHGRRSPGAAVTVSEISTYCAVDTIAMVHLVERMTVLLKEAAGETP